MTIWKSIFAFCVLITVTGCHRETRHNPEVLPPGISWLLLLSDATELKSLAHPVEAGTTSRMFSSCSDTGKVMTLPARHGMGQEQKTTLASPGVHRAFLTIPFEARPTSPAASPIESLTCIDTTSSTSSLFNDGADSNLKHGDSERVIWTGRPLLCGIRLLLRTFTLLPKP